MPRTSTDGSEYRQRASPPHKLRIVDALRGRSHRGMTGTVNDARPPKTADIFVAMGITGTVCPKKPRHGSCDDQLREHRRGR